LLFPDVHTATTTIQAGCDTHTAIKRTTATWT